MKTVISKRIKKLNDQLSLALATRSDNRQFYMAVPHAFCGARIWWDTALTKSTGIVSLGRSKEGVFNGLADKIKMGYFSSMQASERLPELSVMLGSVDYDSESDTFSRTASA